MSDFLRNKMARYDPTKSPGAVFTPCPTASWRSMSIGASGLYSSLQLLWFSVTEQWILGESVNEGARRIVQGQVKVWHATARGWLALIPHQSHVYGLWLYIGADCCCDMR